MQVGGLAALALGMTACSDDDFAADGETGEDEGIGGDAAFDVRPSVEQVHVWHATPGETLEVVDADGNVAQSAMTDELGSIVFREIDPGPGYQVRAADGSFRGPFEVMSIANSQPDQSFYDDQQLVEGFQYITMRDGTQLSVYVQLPGPIEEGPYPTLMNYSGYDPSKPGKPLDVGFSLDGLCEDYPVLCDAPEHPSGIIGGVLQFATVGVNMRGTGCSGGAYDFFEPLQLLDGYDAVEIIAAQPWVKGHKIGLAGLSYPGISQIFVASTHPPSLAAITPLSVIADVQSTLVPGGILNDGFAINWADRVLNGAQPYGKGWEQKMVDAGDMVCEENQLLHGQAVDVIQKAYDNPFYDPTVADPLNLNLLAETIDVPVFLSGAWQDEQTGPGFAGLLDKFTSAPLTRFTVFNGVHPDGYGPQLLTEWFNFLSFYVSEEIPIVPDEIRTLAPFLFEMQFGAATQLPDDRFGEYADFAQAKADYEAESNFRAMFEVGANPARTDGFPWANFEANFEQWPPETTEARRWYLREDGTLSADAPTETESASKFEYDASEGPQTNLAQGGDPWDLVPNYEWLPSDPGEGLMFESDAFTEETVMLGQGSVDLWVRSTANDADLEVSIVEHRSDGKESYIQSGWLRTSLRTLAPDATELRPTKTWLEADAKPLPEGEWELARVELMAFAHVFRPGSKLRVYIDTPGGTRAEWKFDVLDLPAGTEVGIAHEDVHPSSVVLPVISGVDAPDALPECQALRGQPCRDAVAVTNTPF